jgi:hypothetical protein
MMQKFLNWITRPYIAMRDRYVERQLGLLCEQERFELIYRTGYWKGLGKGSRSGEGSSMTATDAIRQSLPVMLKSRSIRTMLDLPCGDWHWMSTIDLGDIDYIGADIVEEMVTRNQLRYGASKRRFVKLDLTRDALPRCDLVFVRDCLVHLEEGQIRAAVSNIADSGSTYLAATTFSNVSHNSEPRLADRWRPLNLMLPPFSFPQPVEMLDDRSDINPHDAWKYMGVWRVSDLVQNYLQDHNICRVDTGKQGTT